MAALKTGWIVALALTIGGTALGASSEPLSADQQVFDRLQELVGRWQAQVGERTVQLEIRQIAAKSALVETWTTTSGQESLTIYTMDGDALVLTHYCPQGNQPRLRFDRSDSDGRHWFRFVDGTGLQDPAGGHLHVMWTRIDGPDQFARGERYVPNGTDTTADLEQPTAPLVFRRAERTHR